MGSRWHDCIVQGTTPRPPILNCTLWFICLILNAFLQLETDPSILLKKCHQALDRYQHNLVIGNLLATRKYEVVFVSGEGEEWIRVPQAKEGEGQLEIESEIVPKVVTMHEKIIVAKRAAKAEGR